MNEQVSEPDNAGLFDVWSERPRVLGETSDSLSNVLEVPHSRVVQDFVLGELVERLPIDEPRYLLAGVDDVEQVETIPTQP